MCGWLVRRYSTRLPDDDDDALLPVRARAALSFASSFHCGRVNSRMDGRARGLRYIGLSLELLSLSPWFIYSSILFFLLFIVPLCRGVVVVVVGKF